MSDATAAYAIVRDFLQRVDRAEWNALPEFYSANAVIEQPFAKPQPVVLHGRESIRAHFLAASRAPFRLRVTDPVIRTTSDPEVIVAEYGYDGEATTTGRCFTVANIQVFRIRNGEIVATRDFHDHAAISEALRP